MSVETTIINKLKSNMKLLHLEVVNESVNHNVPPGSESHFKVVIVSDEFVSLSLIARHRLIYTVLSAEIMDNIHALTIHAYTGDDWSERQGTSPMSPPCRGGSK